MESFNSIKEKYLLDKIQNEFGLEVFTPGLERSRPLYIEFINSFKQKNVKIITIAGTNGKGQTTHTIGHSLVCSNQRVAWWTSPHILSIRERFCFQGKDISYDELEDLIDEGILKIRKLEFKISFYEFLFYIFLNWLKNKDINFLILEVGLGGKYDAVNHFDADVVGITSISRDHQVILGNTYNQILMEKLGVTRKNGVLFTSFKLQYLIDVTKNYSLKYNINYTNLFPSSDYFISNQNLAGRILNYLGFTTLIDGNQIKFKGREEDFLWQDLEFKFIGAHNPDGMRETIARINKNQEIYDILLFSFSKRDISDIVLMLKTILEFTPTKTSLKMSFFDHPKAINVKILEDVQKMLCHNRNIEFIKDWKAYLDELSEADSRQKILVLGSYYFIGEVQSYITSKY